MMDLGEAFITGLITGQHDEIGTSQNNDDGDNDPVTILAASMDIITFF